MRSSVHGPGRPSWPPISRFSSTVSDGNRRRPSGTSAMPWATIAMRGQRVDALAPSNAMLPRLLAIRPAIDLQQRALARAVGADHGDHLARADFQVDAEQRLEVAVEGVEALAR